jgi:AraC-like DNA-binding protein
LLGLKENKSNVNQDENHIISMAKQYIEDNIDANPSVSDISKYCHLGIKQLTRIFTRYENTSPGKYIISRRIARIETFLTKQTISIKDISDIMNFNNEYYFNSFFKKYSGMPPGEYRKMFCANTLKEKVNSKRM